MAITGRPDRLGLEFMRINAPPEVAWVPLCPALAGTATTVLGEEGVQG
jgi:hypothetical protein